jgi:hypothetical protein
MMKIVKNKETQNMKAATQKHLVLDDVSGVSQCALPLRALKLKRLHCFRGFHIALI